MDRITLHKIFSENLKFHKLWARWDPRVFTEEQKMKSVTCAPHFLNHYHEKSEQLSENIVREM